MIEKSLLWRKGSGVSFVPPIISRRDMGTFFLLIYLVWDGREIRPVEEHGVPLEEEDSFSLEEEE
jgi:hypothetical protein